MTRAFVFVVVTAACSTSRPSAPPPACLVHFSGAANDTASAATCAVTRDDAGVSLTVHASGQDVVSFDASIALPAVSGRFSSDSSSGWTASAAAGDAGCAFTAGSGDTPHGSFTVDLDADGGADLHGVLTVVLYVHAPPLTDCGPLDVENVEAEF